MLYTFSDNSYIDLREDNTSTTFGTIAHEVRSMVNEVLRENNILDSYKNRMVLFQQFKTEIDHLTKKEVQKLIHKNK